MNKDVSVLSMKKSKRKLHLLPPSRKEKATKGESDEELGLVESKKEIETDANVWS